MAAAVAAPTTPRPTTAPTSGTSTPKYYDPVKAVEGMFNGSVSRIADVLKDPKNYGGSTKYILEECAKRYQDALDDCEIQILDAKWYLEKKLAENKAKREAQAREASATKRKADEMQGVRQNAQPGSPKRARSEERQEKQQPSPKSTAAAQDLAVSDPTIPKSREPAQKESRESESQSSKPTESRPVEPAKEPEKSQQKPQSEPPKPQEQQTQPAEPPQEGDMFVQNSAQGSPAMTNEDPEFESMFGNFIENNDDTNNDMNNDMGFDMLDDTATQNTFASNADGNVSAPPAKGVAQKTNQSQPQPQTQTQNQNPSYDQPAKDDFLSGLQEYANQNDELNPSQNNNVTMNTDNPFTNDADRNIFDDMLAGGDFGNDFGGVDLGNTGIGGDAIGGNVDFNEMDFNIDENLDLDDFDFGKS